MGEKDQDRRAPVGRSRLGRGGLDSPLPPVKPRAPASPESEPAPGSPQERNRGKLAAPSCQMS